jgi:hypothetical protein
MAREVTTSPLQVPQREGHDLLLLLGTSTSSPPAVTIKSSPPWAVPWYARCALCMRAALPGRGSRLPVATGLAVREGLLRAADSAFTRDDGAVPVG